MKSFINYSFALIISLFVFTVHINAQNAESFGTIVAKNGGEVVFDLDENCNLHGATFYLSLASLDQLSINQPPPETDYGYVLPITEDIPEMWLRVQAGSNTFIRNITLLDTFWLDHYISDVPVFKTSFTIEGFNFQNECVNENLLSITFTYSLHDGIPGTSNPYPICDQTNVNYPSGIFSCFIFENVDGLCDDTTPCSDTNVSVWNQDINIDCNSCAADDRSEIESGSSIITKPTFSIAPTLVTNHLDIKWEGDINEFQIYDMNGRVLQSVNANLAQHSNRMTMDISDLPKGVYIIKSFANNYSEAIKFIKQ